MEKVEGCVEYAAVLNDFLLHAKHSHRSLHALFLDLKNSFVSVPHTTIRFALDRYAIPPPLAAFILNFYSKLVGCVEMKSGCTGLFGIYVGTFQGDPMSPITFNIVFNLVLE